MVVDPEGRKPVGVLLFVSGLTPELGLRWRTRSRRGSLVWASKTRSPVVAEEPQEGQQVLGCTGGWPV